MAYDKALNAAIDKAWSLYDRKGLSAVRDFLGEQLVAHPKWKKDLFRAELDMIAQEEGYEDHAAHVAADPRAKVDFSGAKTPTCAGGVPIVQLAFEKKGCARGGEKVTTPSAVVALINRHYGCKPQEVFLSLAISSANEVVSIQEVGLGGVSQAAVDPKILFGGALAAAAPALIVAHNHPSGNAEPSAQDDALTQQLVRGAELLSIRILDHFIIGKGGAYFSYVEHGRMPGVRLAGYGDESATYETSYRIVPFKRFWEK